MIAGNERRSSWIPASPTCSSRCGAWAIASTRQTGPGR